MDLEPGSIDDKSARSVFVGNIPYEVTEERLKDIFSAVGPVLSFKLVFDRENGKPRGYGFCEFSDTHLARTAINNLNGYEINGRALRVDSACTEKSRMEMQSLMNASGSSAFQSPYGDAVDPSSAPESISKAVATLPPEQMFLLMKQMKDCIQQNPEDARTMLLKNPQLSYALLQALVVMRIVDPEMALQMLHKPPPKPPSFVEPPRQQQPPPQLPIPFPGSSRPPYGPPPTTSVRPNRPPAGFPEMEGPPPVSYEMFRQEQQPPPSGRFARDPRNRDPRADRGASGMDISSGPPPLPPQLATADPARRQLLMQVLQLPDDAIAALPAEQRASILELKKQINAYPK